MHTDTANHSLGKTSDYTTALVPDNFRGLRIGVPRAFFYDMSKTTLEPEVYAATEVALKKMAELGAVIVDPADLPSISELWYSGGELTRTRYEFKEDLPKYLSELKDSKVRTLSDLIKLVCFYFRRFSVADARSITASMMPTLIWNYPKDNAVKVRTQLSSSSSPS